MTKPPVSALPSLLIYCHICLHHPDPTSSYGPLSSAWMAADTLQLKVEDPPADNQLSDDEDISDPEEDSLRVKWR